MNIIILKLIFFKLKYIISYSTSGQLLPFPPLFIDPQTFPLPQSTALLTHSREEQASKGQQPNMSNKTVQNSTYPSWIRQSNRR